MIKHKKCGTVAIQYGSWYLCPTCKDLVFNWRSSLSYIKVNWYLFIRYLLMVAWAIFFAGIIAGLTLYRSVIH